MIELTDFLILGAILFTISMAGIFLNRKNVLILLMAIELMLLAVYFNSGSSRGSDWACYSGTALPQPSHYQC